MNYTSFQRRHSQLFTDIKTLPLSELLTDFLHTTQCSFVRVELNCLFNVTINDISVIYVTAHRCAGGLKKKYDLRSGSQRHRHFVGFFNVPVLAPTRDQPFYTVIPTQHLDFGTLDFKKSRMFCYLMTENCPTMPK